MRSVVNSSILLVTLGIIAASGAEGANGDLVFHPNRGQESPSVRFLSQGGSVIAQFADNAVSLKMPNAAVRVEFAGASLSPALSLVGDTVVYRDPWPGIEVQYAPYWQTVKSEYHVAAGANPDLIRLRYEGAGAARILSDGALAVGVAGAEFLESPPFAYQERGERVSVPVAYRIDSDGMVGFALGRYDPSLPLVIDPVMNYSTLFGGSGDTTVTSVAFDTFGNPVVAGWTTATDLPANGAKKKSGGGVEAFVAKLSASGNRVVWCSYLGGIGDDRAFGVAVDSSNNVYVTGWTQSTNFPVFGAIQAKLAGSRNAFVTKFNALGTAILYSTYLGGYHDQGNGIVVDSSGSAYVTGDASSPTFPVMNAYQKTFGGGQMDAFVAKLNPAGNGLVFSTYVGGSGADHGASIALDASRNVYITGSTYSTNFPVGANATQPRIGGAQDAFVAELSATGATMLFATYIGGSGGTPGLGEGGSGVAVDSSGNLYVAGVTSSIDFPTTAGAFQKSITNGGANDHGFAWKLNTARQIVYSTYLAGTNMDVVNDLAVDPAGNAYLVGTTSSTDFPGVRAFQSAITGSTNGFLLKLNSAGSGLIFGSFLGGSSADAANSVAVDGMQNVLVGGLAQSSDFPLLNPAQTYSNGPFSGFVTKVVSGWKLMNFLNGSWCVDVWHDTGWDGTSWTAPSWWFGQAGDIPIPGDWNHSGKTSFGVFRNGLWILDSNGNGYLDGADRQFTFGQAGDTPIAGDWDGTGSVKVGVFRRGLFILDLSGHTSGIATGKQDLSFSYGNSTDLPVAGDWGATGVTKVGIFRNGTWYLDTNNSHSLDAGDQSFVYGIAGDIPLVGDWDGSGTTKIGVARGNVWVMLNSAGDYQYHAGVDTLFYWGAPVYSIVMGY